MSDDDKTHHTELPKFLDNGADNNYAEWRVKSYHKLLKWKLLKYIEGPSSIPPNIPPLRHTTTHHGVDDDGHVSTFHILGNAVEHEQALTEAEPWMTGNNTTLSRIVASLPKHLLHSIEGVKYAKVAWENLRSIYQPHNSLRAATVKSQIMSYRCQPDMDVAKWLNDMQSLYTSLCGLDPKRMNDSEFALAILDLMPQEGGWRDFVSSLHEKVRDTETQNLPIASRSLISTIRDEFWYCHKDDFQMTSHIFSARYDAIRRSATQKRPRNQDIVASATTSPSLNKRPRLPNPAKAHLVCTNAHCASSRGSHDTTDCIAYKGAKQGQYSEWWRGPWNIHLPESQ